MEVYCNGTARVRHRETGQIVEIESDELDWDMIGSDERQMGAEFHYEAAVEHSDLGKITWGLWEYPVGIENYRETDVGPHEVVEDFDYGLEHTEDDNDEWFDPVPPDEPFTIYLNSFRESTDLLAQSGSDHGGHLVNRLVFSHQVTALEAYLGDTIAKEVFRDRNAMQRLVDQDSDLKKEKFTLTEISKDPLLVERKVREHSRGIIYHNRDSPLRHWAQQIYSVGPRGGYAPPVHVIKLTETREITPSGCIRMRSGSLPPAGTSRERSNSPRDFPRDSSPPIDGIRRSLSRFRSRR